jgi:anti-anti-sigma regulatory factor
MEGSFYRGIPTVLVHGDVGDLEAIALRDFVLAVALESIQGVIVDFVDVSCAEADSLCDLAGVAQALHSTGQHIAVVCRNDNVLRLFALSRQGDRFRVFDDLESAAEYLWDTR